MTLTNTIWGRIFIVQKNGTPWRKPKNNGGSPKGVREPPMFATRKMKKMITCFLDLRLALARMMGRIRSIAAPVVPIQDARMVPMMRIIVFTFGVPARVPLNKIPPEAVNNPHNNIMNGM